MASMAKILVAFAVASCSEAAVVPTDPATQAQWAEGALVVYTGWMQAAGAAGNQPLSWGPFASESKAYHDVMRIKGLLAGGAVLVGATTCFDAVNSVGRVPGVQRHKGITRHVWNAAFSGTVWLRDFTLEQIEEYGFEDVRGKFEEFEAVFATIDRNLCKKYVCCLALACFIWRMVGVRQARGVQNREFASLARAKRAEILHEIAEHIGKGEKQQAKQKCELLGLMMLADNGSMKLTHSPF